MKLALSLVLSCTLLLMERASAQELGRLFFTPEQRSALDARRKARMPDRPSAPTVVTPIWLLGMPGYPVWVFGAASSSADNPGAQLTDTP